MIFLSKGIQLLVFWFVSKIKDKTVNRTSHAPREGLWNGWPELKYLPLKYYKFSKSTRKKLIIPQKMLRITRLGKGRSCLNICKTLLYKRIIVSRILRYYLV